MNYHRNKPRPKQNAVAVLKSRSGISALLLTAIAAFFFILVAVGIYASKNYQTLIAHGITAAMNAVIHNSDLPVEEKSEIKEIIYQVKDGYLSEDITAAELGLILEAIGKCPALTIGLVTQFQQSYIVPSGLGSDEKRVADLDLNRFARGLSDGSLDWEIVNGILAQISEPGEDGNHHLRAPADVSDNEIRQVLAAVKDAVDESGISKEKIEIDISDEFKKSVEETLGRSLS